MPEALDLLMRGFQDTSCETLQHARGLHATEVLDAAVATAQNLVTTRGTWAAKVHALQVEVAKARLLCCPLHMRWLTCQAYSDHGLTSAQFVG